MSIDAVEQTIAAHGGRELWDGAGEVSIRFSSGGLAFASKLQGHAVRDVEARIATRGQHVTLAPFPRAGQRGVMDQSGTVSIVTDAGEVLHRRENARAAFGDLRHRLWWDRLDILYFAAYAVWTYVSVPFVLERQDYEVSEIEPWVAEGERWRRIAVRFPEPVHTHSRDQVFYLDERGLIFRHDYTAEPIGAWARAAHYCTEHQRFDGLVIPTCRRVYPRRPDNSSRRAPRLVWIDVPEAAVRD